MDVVRNAIAACCHNLADEVTSWIHVLQDCGSTVVVLIRALAPMLHARSPVAREATGTRSHASRPTSTSCTSFWSSWNQHDAAPLKPKLSIVEPDRRKGRSFSAYRVHAPRRRLDQWCRAASCRSIAKHHHADIQAHPTQRRPAGIHNPPAAVVVQGKIRCGRHNRIIPSQRQCQRKA